MKLYPLLFGVDPVHVYGVGSGSRVVLEAVARESVRPLQLQVSGPVVPDWLLGVDEDYALSHDSGSVLNGVYAVAQPARASMRFRVCIGGPDVLVARFGVALIVGRERDYAYSN